MRLRWAAIAALVPFAGGCFGGHLLGLARRRSEVTAFHEARATAGGVVVRTSGVVTDDDGRPVGPDERWILVLDGGAVVPRVGPPPEGSADVPSCTPADGPRPCVLRAIDAEGRPVLAVRGFDQPHEVPARRLTVVRTEPWAYALMPGALAVDVLAIPFLVFMSPAILIVGD